MQKIQLIERCLWQFLVLSKQCLPKLDCIFRVINTVKIREAFLALWMLRDRNDTSQLYQGEEHVAVSRAYVEGPDRLDGKIL